jgi:hypothetical protein
MKTTTLVALDLINDDAQITCKDAIPYMQKELKKLLISAIRKLLLESLDASP